MTVALNHEQIKKDPQTTKIKPFIDKYNTEGKKITHQKKMIGKNLGKRLTIALNALYTNMYTYLYIYIYLTIYLSIYLSNLSIYLYTRMIKK